MNAPSMLATIRGMSVFMLARFAGVSAPDSADSPGAAWLRDVRDEFVSAVDEGRLAEGSGESLTEVFAELANSSVSPYRHDMWRAFVDLAAYQERHGPGPVGDASMSEAAEFTLESVARRLFDALHAHLPEEDEESEVRFICKRCGAQSPVGIGYVVCDDTATFPAPAPGCINLHVIPLDADA